MKLGPHPGHGPLGESAEGRHARQPIARISAARRVPGAPSGSSAAAHRTHPGTLTSRNVAEQDAVESAAGVLAKVVDDHLLDELMSRAHAEGPQLTGRAGCGRS